MTEKPETDETKGGLLFGKAFYTRPDGSISDVKYFVGLIIAALIFGFFPFVIVLPFVFEAVVHSIVNPVFMVMPLENMWGAGCVLVVFLALKLVLRSKSREFRAAFGLALVVAFVVAVECYLFARTAFGDGPRALRMLVALGSLVLGALCAVAAFRGAARLWQSLAARGWTLLSGCVLVFAIVFMTIPSRRPVVPGAERLSAGKPDVILLILDTARADHLSFAGYSRTTTPNLDRYAAQARVYSQARSVASWTPPSHASIFTGLLPAQHGQDLGPLRTAEPLLAEVFRDAGYQTLGVVNNPLLGEGWERGFDLYRSNWQRPHFSIAFVIWWFEQRASRSAEGFNFIGDTPRTLEWARRWWGSHGDAPRFMMINLLDPHLPYGRGHRYAGKFLDARTREAEDLPDDDMMYFAGKVQASDEDWDRLVAQYDSDVFFADREIGAFLDWLDRRGDLDRTVFVLTSDHGERLGERGLIGHGLGLDETLLRVPLLVRYPPAVEPGIDTRLVQTPGIFSTLCDLAGIDPPPASVERMPSLDDLWPDAAVAQMKAQQWFIDSINREHGPGFDGTPYEGDWSAACDGEWKLVRSTAGRQMLFHLPDDPAEERDVSAEHPEHVERLSPFLDELPEFADGAEIEDLTEEELEKMRGLGYLN